MSKLHLALSAPRHGWLPVRLALNGTVVRFHARRYPNDPVRDLYKAIAVALNGGLGTVLWHQEPEGYFFELIRIGEVYHLRVLHAEQCFFTEKKKVAVASGPAAEIVQPLVRALRQFAALPHDPWQQWNITELPALDALERLVSGADDNGDEDDADHDGRQGRGRARVSRFPLTGT